jgi:hypothetical protein
MKKLLGFALLFFLSAIPAFGQSKAGSVTAASTDCSVSGSCVSMTLSTSAGAATITVGGSFSGTLNFELSGDNGVTWTAAPTASTTSAGVTNFNVAGYSNIRVRGNPFASGTATITIFAGAGSKLGAGAATGTVTSVIGSAPIASDGNTVTPTISCPTCNTSAAAITNNVLAKGSGGAQGLANSSVTDNGTTVAATEPISSTGKFTSGANGGTAGEVDLNGSTSGTQTMTTSSNGSTLTISGTVATTTFNASSLYAINGRNIIAAAVPTIATGGCGGSGASIVNAAGTASFNINVGTAPTSAGCTITLGAATNEWNCTVVDGTTHSATVNQQIQTAWGTTTAKFQNFDTTGTAQAPVASDIYHVTCMAH